MTIDFFVFILTVLFRVLQSCGSFNTKALYQKDFEHIEHSAVEEDDEKD